MCVCTVTRFFVRCCVVTEKQKKCTEFLFRHFNTSNGTKRHAGKRERERAHQTFTHSFCESRRRKKKKKERKKILKISNARLNHPHRATPFNFCCQIQFIQYFLGGFCLWFYFWWWKEQRNFILNEEEAVGSTLIDCFQPSLTITVVQNL